MCLKRIAAALTAAEIFFCAQLTNGAEERESAEIQFDEGVVTISKIEGDAGNG